MPILVECGNCFHAFNVPEKFAGKTGKCKACGAVLKVPHPVSELDAEDQDHQFQSGPAFVLPRSSPAAGSQRKKSKKSAKAGSFVRRFWGVGGAVILVLLMKTGFRLTGALLGQGAQKLIANLHGSAASNAAHSGSPAQTLATSNPQQLFPSIEIRGDSTPGF